VKDITPGGEKLDPIFVKSGFCPSEMDQIERLIQEGFGKNKSDIIRKATIEFILKYGGSE